jgi:hypothetical protein
MWCFSRPICGWATKGVNVNVNELRFGAVRASVNANVFSLGLSNANEEQQVYSAIWDMP